MNILKVLTKRRITGNIGEEAAANLLRRSGYKIIKRNYVALGHEIDIIAENREYLVFVEVKTRTIGQSQRYEERPASAVTKEKIRDIITVAREYSSYNPSDKMRRFDIIEVYLDRDGSIVKTEHLISAFTADRIY